MSCARWKSVMPVCSSSRVAGPAAMPLPGRFAADVSARVGTYAPEATALAGQSFLLIATQRVIGQHYPGPRRRGRRLERGDPVHELLALDQAAIRQADRARGGASGVGVPVPQHLDAPL